MSKKQKFELTWIGKEKQARLEQDFAGKVRCIYIDPPYNTGNAFEHYVGGEL